MGIGNQSPEDGCRSVDNDVVPTLQPAARSRSHARGWKSAKTPPPGSWIGVYVPAGPSAGACRTVAPSFCAFLVAASISSTWTYGNHPKCSPRCGTTEAHGFSPPTMVTVAFPTDTLATSQPNSCS